jgi:Protein of unknown function (DUF4242)
VPTYLVERYVPRAASAHLAEIVSTAKAAAGQARDSPGAIRYLAVTLVPGDELCYCLFEAPTIEAIQQAHELAHVPCERIVEAFHATAHPPGGESSPP